jgi:hypothetical protein
MKKKKLKKSNRHINWLNCGIFPATVMLTVGYSWDEIILHLKKKKIDEWINPIASDRDSFQGVFMMAKAVTMEHSKTKNVRYFYYLYMRDCFDFSDDQMCALAHEIVHLCQFFLPTALDRNKEIEAEAYLHTHLMRQCLKILRTTDTIKPNVW